MNKLLYALVGAVAFVVTVGLKYPARTGACCGEVRAATPPARFYETTAEHAKHIEQAARLRALRDRYLASVRR